MMTPGEGQRHVRIILVVLNVIFGLDIVEVTRSRVHVVPLGIRTPVRRKRRSALKVRRLEVGVVGVVEVVLGAPRVTEADTATVDEDGGRDNDDEDQQRPHDEEHEDERLRRHEGTPKFTVIRILLHRKVKVVRSLILRPHG